MKPLKKIFIKIISVIVLIIFIMPNITLGYTIYKCGNNTIKECCCSANNLNEVSFSRPCCCEKIKINDAQLNAIYKSTEGSIYPSIYAIESSHDLNIFASSIHISPINTSPPLIGKIFLSNLNLRI